MNSKTEKEKHIKIQKSGSPSRNSLRPEKKSDEVIHDNIEELCDENLTSLKKIHAILLNCVNLNKKQKLEFCNSERYFMKLYLKKLRGQDDNK